MNLKYFFLTVALTLAVLAGLEKIAPAPKELMYPPRPISIDEKDPVPNERPLLVKFEESGLIAKKSKPFPIWNGSTCDGG